VKGSIPGMGRRFFCSPYRPEPALGPTRPRMSLVLETPFRGIKRPGVKLDHLSTSNAGVKNSGAIHPLLNIYCRVA
jgi:hypothetical protein